MFSYNRRTDRSKFREKALEIFLRRQLGRYGVKTLVVANSEGLLVAYAGGSVDPVWAAALAPSIEREGWTYPRGLPDRYRVMAVPLSFDTIYVFAVGITDIQRLTLTGIAEGVQRILTAKGRL